MLGKIKHIVAVKGFGFISGAGQPDYFFHVRDTLCDFDALKPGDGVTFDVATAKDGRTKAIGVTLVE